MRMREGFHRAGSFTRIEGLVQGKEEMSAPGCNSWPNGAPLGALLENKKANMIIGQAVRGKKSARTLECRKSPAAAKWYLR
jgi:hypothetical protein